MHGAAPSVGRPSRPTGEATTLLALTGVYRLAGPAYAGLTPAIVHCFAAVTIRSFIARLACALMHPAGAALRQHVQPEGLPTGPPGLEMP
jgi:hypothetical protein